jgi:metallo-beta-lactamase family protein
MSAELRGAPARPDSTSGSKRLDSLESSASAPAWNRSVITLQTQRGRETLGRIRHSALLSGSDRTPPSIGWQYARMEIRFLGAANTVTGSQFLLITDKAHILVDCGMFQGGPHEVVRNRVPLDYDPATLDAIVLTHAHLDHCGLIPLIVDEGFKGPIYCTAGTADLAALVLLDSGKLQDEYAKRHRRWAARHPEKAEHEEQRQLEAIEEQVEIAQQAEGQSGEQVESALGRRAGQVLPDGSIVASGFDELALYDEQALGTRMGYPPFGHPDYSAAMAGHPTRPNLLLEEPLYDQDKASASLRQFSTAAYETEVHVAPGITAVFHDAGHILGSSIVELHVAADGGTPARTLVFSGDLGRSAAPILREPTILRQADYVFVESTYGGRRHEPPETAIKEFRQAVLDTIEQKGVLLVPAFAIGRTQEVIWTLDYLLDKGLIPRIPLYLDSPMASKASAIYRSHKEYYDADALADLRRGEGPIEYDDAMETKRASDSEKIERSRRPYVVVASNGMLTGGRVLGHLRRLIGDSKAMILFVGYQGEGTMGARLQAGAKSARIDGQEYQVRCAMRSISGFSAHADEPQILAWLGHFIEGRKTGGPGVPRRVFIVHGDPEAQELIEPKIAALGLPTLIPHWRQRVVLD